MQEIKVAKMVKGNAIIFTPKEVGAEKPFSESAPKLIAEKSENANKKINEYKCCICGGVVSLMRAATLFEIGRAPELFNCMACASSADVKKMKAIQSKSTILIPAFIKRENECSFAHITEID